MGRKSKLKAARKNRCQSNVLAKEDYLLDDLEMNQEQFDRAFLAGGCDGSGYINGESPVSYISGDNRLIFVGSRTYKPQVTAMRTGASVIGAAGFRFLSSIKQIDSMIKTDKHTKFLLAPDGPVWFYDGILDQCAKLYNYLKAKGFELKILWFDQIFPKEGRLEEIEYYLGQNSPDTLLEITWHQYLTLLHTQLSRHNNVPIRCLTELSRLLKLFK